MKLSLGWIGDHCQLPAKLDSEAIAQSLTLHTAEIEAVEVAGSHFSGVITVRVEKISPHPEADRLRLAIINTGAKKVQVVFKGEHLKAGDTVPYAPVGAKVRDLHSESGAGSGSMVMRLAKIRGIESPGMLCTAAELGLSEDNTGIMILPPDTKSGQDLKKALGLTDTVLHLDNHALTHRTDLWGHWGWARELHALFGWTLKEVPLLKLKNFRQGTALKIASQDKKLCPRRICALVSGIKIGPSPRWLQQRLQAAGIRAINNVVDITNYVMLEFGRPLHAFDARVCQDGKSYYLEARHAGVGEKIRALDEKEYTLTPEMLVIASRKAALDIAGVMGGHNTSVLPDTNTIVLECANFDAANIRRTSFALSLPTEAATRFSKGLPPKLIELGVQRALYLIKELCPSAKIEAIADTGAPATATVKSRLIKIPITYCHTLIGRAIPTAEIKQHLTRLGLQPKITKTWITVVIPWWRVGDLKIDTDIVEEIARLSGYEKVAPAMPLMLMNSPAPTLARQLAWQIQDIMCGLGVDEVFTYPFVGKAQLKIFGLDAARLSPPPGSSPSPLAQLTNPPSAETAFLRPRLLPNLVQAAARNWRHFPEGLAFFEVGQVFSNEDERAMLTVLVASGKDQPTPDQPAKDQSTDAAFRRVQEIAHQLCQTLHVNFHQARGTAPSYYHPGRHAQLEEQRAEAAAAPILLRFGELHPQVAKAFDINTRLATMEVHLDTLLAAAKPQPAFQPASRFPKIERDLAVIVDERLEFQTLAQTIQKVDPKLITGVVLFDTYGGKQIPTGKKSLALRLTFQSTERTLEDTEVNAIQAKVCQQLIKQGGEIRTN